jgi:predicted ATPase/class 3 adenylate cyclase
MKLPVGTVTLLFTDIEKSTRLLDRDVAAMRAVLVRHHDLVSEAVQQRGGQVFETVGDAVYAAFATGSDALQAAFDAQRALLSEPVGPDRLLARMTVHSGELELRDAEHYVGEPLVRAARILVLGHGGQTLVSGSAAALIGSRLPPGAALRDLGWHALKDLARREQLFQLEHRDLPRAFPALISLGSWPNNLPAPLTSFVGRESEITHLASVLRESRLMTLTGAGGSGKTRLAIELATVHGRAAAHGAWFVDLAPLADASQIVPTVLKALSLEDHPEARRGSDAILGAVTEYLRPKQALMVLDNCEHLLDGTAVVASSLLADCPTLRIVATSREPLGLAGEQVYRVPGLDKAVELFIERARAADPAFVVDDRVVLDGICDRLDRMPLAIELAAARVRAMSLRVLSARLDDRFRILTGSARAATRRQQTLRATVDWSHALLTEREQILWRRCGVFFNTFELASVEAVCGSTPVGKADVLDVLTSLVDKSLVIAARHERDVRYRLLETLREYALERLAQAGEGDVARSHHADFFLVFAEAESSRVEGGDAQQAALGRLDVEIDNLRAALRWLTEHDVAKAARLGLALFRYLQSRPYIAEIPRWITAVTERIGFVEPALHGEVLNAAAVFATFYDDYDHAGELARRALAWFDERNEPRGMSLALRHLARLAEAKGDHPARVGYLEQALARASASGDQVAIAGAEGALARERWQAGDYDAARAAYEHGIRIRRALGDTLGVEPLLQDLAYVESDAGFPDRGDRLALECVALSRELRSRGSLVVALNTLGNIRRQMGRLDESAQLHEEAHEIASSLGEIILLALTKLPLAEIALERGNVERSSQLGAEALRILSRLDSYQGVTWCYDLHARIAMRRDDPERAIILMAAAVTTRMRLRLVPPPFVQRQTNGAIADIRAHLSDERFAMLWARGEAMSRAEATAYALPGNTDAHVPISPAPSS